MPRDLEISLLGEFRVASNGVDVNLPASRKARALLAFLAATGRPHRRERLCELFWELPDDPKAALRWALSRLRGAVDVPGHQRIVADRERVQFDDDGVYIDIKDIQTKLRQEDVPLTLGELEDMVRRLDLVFLDGLDEAGNGTFASWLIAEREDARAAQIDALRRLANHPDVGTVAARKWQRLWRNIDPEGAAELDKTSAQPRLHPQEPQKDEDQKSEETSAPGSASAPHPAPSRRGGLSASPTGRELRAQRIGFCEVSDRTKIAYATIGKGPPILKAANWLNHLEFDWESPIWGKSFAAIARYRTFIRYDERGNGLSDWDVEDLTFEAFVEDLEAVADHLGLERFPLLGISQGCAVSIEYAVRHPERVSGLVLIGGYAAGWRYLASPEEQARRDAVRALTEVGWGTDNPAYRHIFSQTFMPEASADELAWFDEFQRQTTSPANAARFQDAFGHIDVRHRLADVRAPTIVLHSKYDQRIPLDVGRQVAAGIPNARFVPLESRNHILVENEPAWKVCFDSVSEFLAENGI